MSEKSSSIKGANARCDPSQLAVVALSDWVCNCDTEFHLIARACRNVANTSNAKLLLFQVQALLVLNLLLIGGMTRFFDAIGSWSSYIEKK